MKSTYLYTLILVTIIFSSCEKRLIEEPKSLLTPEYFSTTQGFQSGLDAAYAGNRYIYGTETYMTLTVSGTDEFQPGRDAGGGGNIARYNSSFNSSNSNVEAIWSRCYEFINTCNGLIDNAPKVEGIEADRKASMVAEAKFLRANYYFILVQQWGDVTLNEHFQSQPTTSAVRAPKADVYNFIIKDLNEAIATISFPVSPKSSNVLPGKATKAAAMHLLSKVYLTRGASSAAQGDDYKNAHTIATNLINTIAPANGLRLLPDFADVFAEGNETNNEVLWSVEHTANLNFNGVGNNGGSGPDNIMNHLFVPKYDDQPGLKRDVLNGRPYIRVIPTQWLTQTAFQERVDDTRYNKTFKTVFYANNAATIPTWKEGEVTSQSPAGARVGQPRYTVGDTAIWMPGYDIQLTDQQLLQRYRYRVLLPRHYSVSLAPSLKKYYDTKRTGMDLPSIRPVIVYRLAETYLIAAEALFLDNNPAAVQYINAVRRRAAYPNSNPAIMDISPSMLTLNFILDERSRELAGELTRWPDLVRTGKLMERVKAHNPEAQTIQDFHILRPIPLDQIDATTTGTPYPQNAGWF